MNKNIEEFVKEAILAVDVVTGNTFMDSELQKMYIPDCFAEKFAELIVRECMDCATWVGKFNTNSIEPVHTAHAINKRIMKTFWS